MEWTHQDQYWQWGQVHSTPPCLTHCIWLLIDLPSMTALVLVLLIRLYLAALVLAELGGNSLHACSASSQPSLCAWSSRDLGLHLSIVSAPCRGGSAEEQNDFDARVVTNLTWPHRHMTLAHTRTHRGQAWHAEGLDDDNDNNNDNNDNNAGTMAAAMTITKRGFIFVIS